MMRLERKMIQGYHFQFNTIEFLNDDYNVPNATFGFCVNLVLGLYL